MLFCSDNSGFMTLRILTINFLSSFYRSIHLLQLLLRSQHGKLAILRSQCDSIFSISFTVSFISDTLAYVAVMFYCLFCYLWLAAWQIVFNLLHNFNLGFYLNKQTTLNIKQKEKQSCNGHFSLPLLFASPTKPLLFSLIHSFYNPLVLSTWTMRIFRIHDSQTSPLTDRSSL